MTTLAERYVVGPSPAFAKVRVAVTALFVLITAGLFLVVVPYVWMHYRRIPLRTTIEYVPGSQRVIFHRGRWFAMDDDVLAASAIDNIKIDRSLMGNWLGWCNIELVTRTQTFAIHKVDMAEAQAFRDAVTRFSRAPG